MLASLRPRPFARTALFALVASATFTGAALAQTKLSEKPFSMTVPAGWQVRTVPGLKFKVAVGTPGNGFAPNISVVDEPTRASAAAYADASEKQLQTLEGYKKLGRVPFKTAQGVSAVRLTIQTRQQTKDLRQHAYLIPGKGVMFVVTASALATDGTKHDKAVNAALMTFAVK